MSEKLKALTDRYQSELVVVLRCYFEKPRTTVGWKGLINDPGLDGSFHVNKGLRLARKLLLDVNEIVHRELASGLSMPVGFKNSTDGNVQPAIDAVCVAASEHWFPGVTKQGVSAIFHTTGNDSCHVILRGGSQTGPNFDAVHVVEVCGRLAERIGRPTLMIDCSHGNSLKDFRRQPEVAASIAEQVASGSWQIFGTMIERHLVEGRQDYTTGQDARYGQSITDACLSLEATEPILEQLARAQQRRGTAVRG